MYNFCVIKILNSPESILSRSILSNMFKEAFNLNISKRNFKLMQSIFKVDLELKKTPTLWEEFLLCNPRIKDMSSLQGMKQGFL